MAALLLVLSVLLAAARAEEVAASPAGSPSLDDSFYGNYEVIYRWARNPTDECDQMSYLPVNPPISCSADCAAGALMLPANYTDQLFSYTLTVQIVDSYKDMRASSDCRCEGLESVHRLWKVRDGVYIRGVASGQFALYELYAKVYPDKEEVKALVKSAKSLNKRYRGRLLGCKGYFERQMKKKNAAAQA